jgi:hypothetical protein
MTAVPPKRTEPLVDATGKGTLRFMSFLEQLSLESTATATISEVLIDSGVSASQIASIMKKINSLSVVQDTWATPAQISDLNNRIKSLEVLIYGN